MFRQFAPLAANSQNLDDHLREGPGQSPSKSRKTSQNVATQSL
jgi:hypothetical protein